MDQKEDDDTNAPTSKNHSSSSTLTDFDLDLSATFIDDAISIRLSSFELSKDSLRLYKRYHKPASKYLLCCVLILHLKLAVIERPALISWDVPTWVPMLCEFCFLFFYSWKLYCIASFSTLSRVMRDPKFIVLMTVITLILIDMVVYICLQSYGLYAVRVSRVLRPLLVACWSELRSVRVALRTLRKALPAVLHVVLLYCTLLCTAALMAFKMFGHKNLVKSNGEPYFGSFLDSLFDLYVLVTTANSPDIMMPAFNDHIIYVIFFVSFLVLCYFIYMNIVLAVIYNSYKKNLKTEVIKSFVKKQKQLAKAFEILSAELPVHSERSKIRESGIESSVTIEASTSTISNSEGNEIENFEPKLTSNFIDTSNDIEEDLNGENNQSDPEKKGDEASVKGDEATVKDDEASIVSFHKVSPMYVSQSHFSMVIKRLEEQRSSTLISIMFAVLNTSGTGYLSLDEFSRLADLLSIRVSEIQTQNSWMSYLTHTLPSVTRVVTLIVNSRYFVYFFDGLTLTNAIVIACIDDESFWDLYLEWCFLSLFLLEIILKMACLGGRRFFARAWNMFDFVVIGSAIVIGIVEIILDDEYESRFVLDVLLILRVLRLLKLVGNIRSFEMIVLTLGNILPSLRTYGAVIALFYYSFAMVGMELFQGLVHNNNNSTDCGNTALANTSYAALDYCNNSFNDVLHSYILLFVLTVVNQWHVLTNAFAVMTHPSAKLFFLLFHLLCVTVLLNVFTAFVLEVFLLEYSASKGDLESELEREIRSLGLNAKRLDRRGRSSPLSGYEDLVMQDSDQEEEEENPTAVEEEQPAKKVVNKVVADNRVRFHLSKKVRTVEMLLQKLFQEELEEELVKIRTDCLRRQSLHPKYKQKI